MELFDPLAVGGFALVVSLVATYIAVRRQPTTDESQAAALAIAQRDQTIHLLQDEISSLKVELATLRGVYEEQQGERDKLFRELLEANRKIRNLEDDSHSMRQRLQELEGDGHDEMPLTPLLLIAGDPNFAANDANQLNRARVWYRTLGTATRDDIEDELQRRRQNGDLYPWVHVSAHASAAGIQLADGVARREWWNRQLDGIEVVFLANCDGPRTGDLLAGLVGHVVVLYGEVDTEDVEAFTYEFWSTMNKTQLPGEAYRQALTNVPQLRAYADLRVR